MPARAASLFDRTVAVSSLGHGRYGAHVEPAWNGPASPNGGILAATMLRAAEAELGAGAPPPRTVAAQYLAAPATGAVGLEVEVLRRGKRVCAADVRMRQHELLVCQAIVLFSAPRLGAAALRAAPPPAPAAADVPVLDASAIPHAPPVFGALEVRPTFGPPIFAGAGEAVTGGWVALRGDPAPLDGARLCALTDLWWPAVFGVLPAPGAVPTIQLTVHLRSTTAKASPPVLARFATREIAEGHLEESGELWSSHGELLAESRQLALLPAGRG